jgi:hypothetical protein
MLYGHILLIDLFTCGLILAVLVTECCQVSLRGLKTYQFNESKDCGLLHYDCVLLKVVTNISERNLLLPSSE